MIRTKSFFGPAVVAVLTLVLTYIARITCICLFHQPVMPEELNDFKKL